MVVGGELLKNLEDIDVAVDNLLHFIGTSNPIKYLDISTT